MQEASHAWHGHLNPSLWLLPNAESMPHALCVCMHWTGKKCICEGITCLLANATQMPCCLSDPKQATWKQKEREVYVSKTGESPITKVEIVSNIAESLGVEVAALAGLEKSPKAALRNLEKAVAGLEQLFEHKDYPGGL